MSLNFTLTAELRDDAGKGASRRLRRAGKIPAVLYGGGRDARAISLLQQELEQRLGQEAFYSNILTIKVGDEEQAAILKDVQRHPAKRQVLHVDLQRIVAGEKIRMNVPLHFVGEDVAIGVKDEGGVVSHLMTDVQIICLPKDLPEFIDVDVSSLSIGDSITLSELKLPEGVEITQLISGEVQDQPVVAVQHARVTMEEEEEEVAVEEGEEEPTEEPTAEGEGEGESKDEAEGK